MRISFTALLLIAAASTRMPAQTVLDTEREVSWKTLAPNVAHDQKDIWLAPKKLSKRKYLWPTLAVIGATAVLVALDPKDAPPFRTTTAFSGFNSAFNSSATQWGTLAVPVALYSVGLAARDKKAKSTALLVGEAVGDAEILTTFLKDATDPPLSAPARVTPTHGSRAADLFCGAMAAFLRAIRSRLFPSRLLSPGVTGAISGSRGWPTVWREL